MSDLLNIGLSGLSSARTNLSVTGHNITNVNTPGFSRQSTVQSTSTPQFSGAGYIGSGTTLSDIRRSYSEFLTTQLRSSTALNADVKSYKSQIDQLDGLLASTNTGISPALKSFFSAMQTAAEDPANIPARQLVLSEAEGLARRFNDIYDNVSAQNEFINKQMVTITEQVNRLANTVAELNTAIISSKAAGHPPNDLMDTRDEAIRELSTYIGVTVVNQDDDSLNLFIGSGQPLVVGSKANSIEAVQGNADPGRFDLNFVSGGSRQNISTMVSGGELGGLLRFREEVLDQTINNVGRLALAINDEINRQLGQGLDLKGNVGAALFNDINAPKLMGLRVLGMQDNVSDVSGQLRIDNTQLLHASDYRLEYDGSNYTAYRLSDGAQMNVSATTDPITGEVSLSFADMANPPRDQGFSLTLSAEPNSGDKFLLQPTRRGATDIAAVLDQADQLAFAAGLRSEAYLQNKGTGSIGQPDINMVISNPASPLDNNFVADELNLDALKLIDDLELTYNSNTGRLEFPSPMVPGVTFTEVPEEGANLPSTITGYEITPGQTNTLNFAIQVDDGNGNFQNYTVSLSFSGRPENGDKFTISFNQHGVSDNRNALKLADLQNQQVVGVDANVKDIATGMSFTDDYGDTIERVGTLTAQARQDEIATDAVLKQAMDNRDSLSGVNLDEEAANLIKFEQYYNASAQVIQVARSLFDTLINTFR